MQSRIELNASVDFVLALRSRWADTLYPVLTQQFADAGSTPDEATVHALGIYPWFSWLERGSQKMLWRSTMDLLAVLPDADAKKHADASPDIDEQFELPAWYTDWDIHVQPGGVWSNEDAALVYELGAKLVMLGKNDDLGFHRTFVDTAVPKRDYRQIVDLGCGFGKSTWPFKQAYPDSAVIGIDMAAPCLKLAARRAAERGLEIRFRQANATVTGLDSESSDLVTSTMLLHELPLPVIRDLIGEVERILAPGGIVRFLDFRFTGDFVRDMAMREHGARNNEPYLPSAIAADLESMADDAGLVNARWVAFDERGAGRLPSLDWPERAEWHFPWAVFEAEKAR